MFVNTGSANTIIDCPVSLVFEAITDVTRMGEWSPECVGARWLPPAEGPAPGAEFEGDNVAKVGPLTVKKWTTTSEVTEYEKNEVFEFISAGYTTWRYELEDRDGATLITESYAYEPYEGFQKFLYETLGRRSKGMTDGVQRTLDRLKDRLQG